MPFCLGCTGEVWCLPLSASSSGICWKKGTDTVPSLTVQRDVPIVHMGKGGGRRKNSEEGSMQTFKRKTRLFQHISDWDIAERTREQKHSQAQLRALAGLMPCPISWLWRICTEEHPSKNSQAVQTAHHLPVATWLSSLVRSTVE